MELKFNSSGTVVLLTDYGVEDDYVGLMHASVLRFSPDAKIIDLCHSILPGNIRSAAFLLKKDYNYFPKGSVFVCVVDPGVGSDRDIIIAEVNGYLFIAPDNGLLSPLLTDLESPFVYNLNTNLKLSENISNTFHGRDLFAPLAGKLLNGENINLFADKRITNYHQIDIRPREEDGKIIGEVIWIDRYGNLITNIDCKTDDNYKLVINNRVIRKVEKFCDGNSDEIVWLCGSKSTAEIVINCQNCFKKLKYEVGTEVIFKR